ncbi:MAG: hypothetical protein WC376_05140 [Candidatus Nanoarchaeia archaeon]|jgi:hypothetical protein
MKALAEFYPKSVEANFYVFLKEAELEELAKKPITGTIFMLDKSCKKFSLELKKGDYFEKNDYEVGVIAEEEKCSIYFYESKLFSLKTVGIIYGRVKCLYKYDICLESKAKDYDLTKILNFIDFGN